MTTVVLVCVAGVSGTFLARRMRQLDDSIAPVVATPTSLPALVGSADVILVAPQLFAQTEALADIVGGIPLVPLTPAAYGPLGARAALDAAHDALSSRDAYRVSTTTPNKE